MENEHLNVITDNEALAVEIELQNGDKVILVILLLKWKSWSKAIWDDECTFDSSYFSWGL